MSEHCYLACDLGAESGRVILGRLSDGKLAMEEIHRFPNGAVKIAGSLRWDVLRLFDELKIGLRKAAARGLQIASLSVDSWGVDYVLSGAGQPMLSLPYQYRDSRTDSTFASAMKSPGPELIFSETGIQFMTINSLYQLLADLERNPELLNLADRFLTIADYFHYLFSGVPAIEESLASTTQLYNPKSHGWSQHLIEATGLPAKLFPRIVPSGTRLGPVLSEIAAETGLQNAEVVATCSHDTNAAIAAVPASGNDWAYLSSGTWSLLGVELPAPLVSNAVQTGNYSNEAGFGGTTCFLKTIVGLWILQESRRAWSLEGHDWDYATLTKEAAAAEPFRSLILPDDPRFLKPDDMPAKIAAFCRETGQPVPETPGQITRCIFESLSLLYRESLDGIESLTGNKIARLHIVGGGSQSRLLNQFTADATGRTVLAGPVEATAIGNLLIQAIALGHLTSLAELRSTVAASFPVETYQPADRPAWEQAYSRFASLRAR